LRDPAIGLRIGAGGIIVAGMTEVRDPVFRARYSFYAQGDDLVIDTRIEPGGGLPRHLHPILTERWSVLDGEAEIEYNGAKRIVTPDDGELLVRPGVKHAIANPTDQEVLLRCVAIPAMRLRESLTESAAAAERGLFNRHGLPRGIAGVRWAAGFLKRYEPELELSFPPRSLQRILIALFAR
jgi:mannose-6-phosphate isomerase-like protein (cupin superfamily)